MLQYEYLVEHIGHNLTIVEIKATEFHPARIRIVCNTCLSKSTLGPLYEVEKPGSKPRKLSPGTPFPKSATQGGKAK